MLTGVALLVVYVVGGQTQIEGVLLAVCLASLGIGIVVWAEYLMNTPDRRSKSATRSHRARRDPALSEVLDEEAGFTRRRLLVGMLFGALAGLGAALAIPVLSLGPAPGRELFTTSWAHRQAVGRHRRRRRPGRGPPGREHHDGVPGGGSGLGRRARRSSSASRPVSSAAGPGSRSLGAPTAIVAYSKVCTHAGCPVGLYLASEQHLVCPCHQSTFDVLDGRDADRRARPGGRSRSCRSRWPTTARSRRSATSRSRSGRRSGTSPREDPTARTTPTADARPTTRARRRTAPGRDRTATDRARPARRLARRADRARRRRAGRPAQGLPGSLVVPARRDRAVLLRRAGRHRRVPHLLLHRGHAARHLRRARTRRCEGAEVSAAFDSVMRLSFEVRAGLLMRQVHHWAAARVRGRDRRPRRPRLLHRRIPAAARDQLADRRGAAAAGARRRPHRLLAAGRPAVRDGPADRLLGRPRRSRSSGPWLAYLVFGGEFPTTELIGRLYVFHIMLLPLLMIGHDHGPPRDPVAAEAHPVPRRPGHRGQRGRAPLLAGPGVPIASACCS